MSDGEPVKTARDFRERLANSDILRGDELQTSQWMSQETSSAKMLARRLVAKGILTRWQAGQLLRGRDRLRFGNYKLCEQIGRGASGRVFLAEHIQLHREVAIKILSRHLTQERRIVDRFLKDARQAAKLNHHNLAHVLDMDNAHGQYYLVMEYVQGQDLQELVKASGRLAPDEVLDYLCQAADGLHHAHQAGAVHGDLCPANLMRDEHGVIKVVGWGVGRGVRRLTDQQPLADQPPDSTASDTWAPDDRHVYRAPEQRRDTGAGSVSGDIHALGQTTRYLLTGQLPATPGTGSSGAPLTRGALGFDWNRAGAQVPTWLIEIIERMTAVEPEKRFDTAQAVCVAVQSRGQDGPEHSLTGPVPRADRSESLSISDEANDGPEVSVVSLVRTSRAGDDSSEQPLRFRFGPPVVAGVVAAMALASLLVTAVVYSFGPYHSSPAGSANGSRTAVKESGARRSRPAIRPRRRQASSSALETSLLESRATDGGVKKKEEESVRDKPRGEDLDEPGRVHASSKETPAESGKEKSPASSAKEPRSSSPDQPTENASVSDGPRTKKQSTLESSTAENPFRQFPSAIDLPALDASDTTRGELDIASLAVPARETTVSLLGGAGATGGPGRFILKTDDHQTPPTWTVMFCGDEQDSEDGLEIARFRVEDKQLRFSWEATASQCAAAACLGNCVLRFSVQEHVHELGLRGARTIEPLRVDLQRASIRQNWPLAAMPDRRQVRFEVTQLEDPFPQVHHLRPPHPISAHHEKVMVSLGGEELEEHVLQVAIAPRLQTTFSLDCKAFFKVSPRMDWIPLTKKQLETVVSFVAQKQYSDRQRALQARTALSRLPGKSPNRAALKKTCEALEAELGETNKATNRLKKVQQVRKALAEGAALHFRLYYLAGDCEVDLLRTKTNQ